MDQTTATPGAEAASAATPASSVANQPVQTNEPALSPEAVSAGFTADDFKHPQYGSKAKNLYSGFQKSTEEAKKAKRDLEDLQRFIQTNPELMDAFRNAYRKSQGITESAAAPDEEMPDASVKAAAEVAIGELYTHLGKGDPFAGRKAYEETMRAEMEAILPMVNPKLPPRDRLALAMEIISQRKGKTSTSVPATPSVPETTAGSEMTRGTETTPPRKTPMTDEEIQLDVMRKVGARDLGELARMMATGT